MVIPPSLTLTSCTRYVMMVSLLVGFSDGGEKMRNSKFFSITIMLVFILGCLTNLNLVASNKVQLDPDEILETWIFSRMPRGYPAMHSFFWCPRKQVTIMPVLFQNPDPKGVPKEVVVIKDIERGRAGYISWREGNINWVYERFCQEEWKQRVPNPQE